MAAVASRARLAAVRSRPRLVAVVVLAGAAAALGMGAGSSPPDPAPKRSSPVLPVGARGIASATVDPVRGVERSARAPLRAAAEYYRRTVRRRVAPAAAAEFLPLHREAGRRYGVDWRLLASVHRQETAFSTADTTYHGLNAFGCCAGPMQFNVTNGPVSTWKRYRQAFRAGRRPRRYPHRTRHHPSVYDDFDAIMAAAKLLSDAGAGRSLDSDAWRAAYSYYGHDLFGVTYANQVLARAVAWKRDGFCANCGLDESLVDRFENAYGASVRRQLTADERRRKKQKKQRERERDDKRERRAKRRRKRGDREAEDRARDRSPARRRPSTPRREEKGAPTGSAAPPATTATTTTATPPATPAPAPAPCSAVRRLLGCP